MRLKAVAAIPAGLVLLLSVVPDGLALTRGLECREWSSRYIDVQFFSPGDLADIVAASTLVPAPFMLDHFDGMALPGHVVATEGVTLGTYVHEAVHHQQMEGMGNWTFFRSYVLEWFEGRYAGCGPFDAYRGISLERSARHAEMMLPRDLRGRPVDGDLKFLEDTLRMVELRDSCPRTVCG